MTITIRQLEIIVAVGTTLSFTKASRLLNITQPSVSETVRRVEEELCFRLFDRSTRALTLSPEGEHVINIAKELLVNYENSIQTLRNVTLKRKNRIVIATLPSLTVSLLPRALQEFKKSHPLTDIGIHDVQHDMVIQLLEDGIADLALTFNAVETDHLEFQPIGIDPMLLVCQEGHPLLMQPEAPTWKQLADYPIVSLPQQSSVRMLTESAFMKHNLVLNPEYEVQQIPSAIALVQAGLAISVLPALTLPMARSEGIVTRPILPKIKRESGALFLKKKKWRADLMALICILKKYYKR